MFSFAIDPNVKVITPKDPSVSSVGSESLSAGDIEKINCLYSCDGTGQGTCGGHVSGASGVLQSSSSGKKICKWLLAANTGDAIELSLQDFNVDCSKGKVTV